MKKVTSIFIIILFLFPILLVSAETDFSVLSDTELWNLIEGARNELILRNEKTENDNPLEKDGVLVSISDTVSEIDSFGRAKIDCIVINNSKKSVSISISELFVNGWSVTPSSSICDSLAPGRKALGSIEFDAKKAGVKSTRDINDIELSIVIRDSSNRILSEVSGKKILFEHINAWQLKTAMNLITTTVYWVNSPSNKIYHTDCDCQTLIMEDELVAGTVEQAIYANHIKLCYYCAERDGLIGLVPTSNP